MKIIEERVAFDASNPHHRSVFKYFHENATWGSDGCPFSGPPLHYMSIPGYCRDQLLTWYLSRDRKLTNYE